MEKYYPTRVLRFFHEALLTMPLNQRGFSFTLFHLLLYYSCII